MLHFFNQRWSFCANAKRIILTALPILILFFSQNTLAVWYSNQWTYRSTITINHTKVSNTSQSNFPVLISRTDPNWKTVANGGHVGQSDGGDILFTAADGTKLDHEIEKYVPTTGQLIAWVRVPALSASVDTVIYMYYSNAMVADQWNKTGVWDTNFKGVWHLNEAGPTNVYDSTVNANTGTQSGGVTFGTAGAINAATSFNGSSSYLSMGNGTTINIPGGQLTQSAWVYPTADVVQGTIATMVNGYYFARNSNGTISTYQYGTTPPGWHSSIGTVPLNQWSYVTSTYNGSVLTFYINGVASGTTNKTGNITQVTAYPLRIGWDTSGGARYWNGRIEETRVSSTARSADWIKTEYNNQSSPAAFYTSVSEQTFCGAATDVPAVECQALMNIYSTNNGTNWYNKAGWGTSTTIGSWYGVTVSGGHVTQLNLMNNNLQGNFNISQGNLNSLNGLYLAYNQLISFSGTGLNGLVNLSIYCNQLTSFSGTGLTNLSYLYGNNNQLTSFSGTGLTNLSYLELSQNQLTSFSSTGLTNLHSLDLVSNRLTSFSGTGFTNLQFLSVSGNLLTSFSGTGFTNLSYLSLDNNQLTSFSSTGLSSLNTLVLSSNLLTSFSGTGLSSLAYLYIEHNQLTSFSGTGLSSLAYLYLNTNQIATFSSTGFTNLHSLDLVSNRLTSFSGTGLTNLQFLSVSGNQLTSFDGSNLSNLQTLYLDSNQLTSFSSTGLSSLLSLSFSANQLTSFDSSNLTSLSFLNLSSNYLTSFDSSNLYNLQGLYLDSNQLTSFDSSNLYNLQQLSINSNHLTSFSGNGLSSLQSLNLEYNYITSFDGTYLAALNYLYLDNNQLTSFSGNGLSSLMYLYLYNNQLTSFDATGLEYLSYIDVSNNYLFYLAPSLSNVVSSMNYGNAYFDNNCLSSDYMDSGVYNWLNNYTYGWSNQNPSCPSTAHPICRGSTDVPYDECEGLMSIYDNTGGTSWTNQYNWGTSTQVCTWFGVNCLNGHVDNLILGFNNLSGSFNISGGNLNLLTYLTLSGNQLYSFSPTGMPALQWLYMTNNQISSFDGTGMSALQYLILDNNQLTSFSSTGLTSLSQLQLSQNQLTSFSGTGLGSLVTLYLHSNHLTSFSGVGMGALQQLSLNDNSLTSFSGTGLSSLVALDLMMNHLTSFSGTGLSSLSSLYLDNNQLTSFPVSLVPLTNLTYINIDGNLISSIPQEVKSVSRWSTLWMTYNCLSGSSLDTSITSWLNTYSTDDWTVRNAACPAVSGTMYFCGTDVGDPTNWNDPANWKGNALCVTSAPKLLPDATDNVIVLANVSKNQVGPLTPAPKATVNTLQVLGGSIVSIPIINGGGYKITTSLDGDNNDITWTTSDPAVTITYANPVDSNTTVSVNGKNITITPGMNPAIMVSGITSPDFSYVNGPLYPAFDGNGYVSDPAYPASSVTPLVKLMDINSSPPYWPHDNARWQFWAFTDAYPFGMDLTDGPTDCTDVSPASCTTPALNLPSWGMEGTIQITDGGLVPASASQLIQAVADTPAAAALIYGTPAPGNNGVGAVTAMTKKSASTFTTYPTPMSFLNTSTNAAGNTLTGNANFACTAQNLGIVTGASTFTQCNATTPPVTTSASTDTTPTFTGLCAPNTLVTLYNNDIALTPSALCSAGGTYSITTNLIPSTTPYSITVKQSNRKGPTFGTSNASSPALTGLVSCNAGEVWNGTACSSSCTYTEAPSELKANVDIPYISCTKGGSFKYRISDPNNPGFTPIMSNIIPQGTRILHSGVLDVSGATSQLGDGSLDTSFNPGTGANNVVESTSLQSDGKIMIGGFFTSYNGTSRNYIARLNTDGSLDTSFNPGTGANMPVTSTSLQSDGQIIITGLFTTYNGTSRNRIARLNSNGSLDTSFNPGTGADLQIDATSLQLDGKILIGGRFTSYNGTSRNYIARLNTDGSLDTSFNPGTGANNVVESTSLQSDGKIMIGGFFTSYNGTSRNYIARLNSNGSLDTSFNPITISGPVQGLSLQSDGKILVGGNFITRLNTDGSLDTSFNPAAVTGQTIDAISLQSDGKIMIGGGGYIDTSINRVARLNTDGSLDTSFNPGTANHLVRSFSLQSDGKILIAGYFTTYNGTSRNGIIRLNGGRKAGGYKVECFYSGDNYTTADTCTKTMVVRASTADNEVQGCSRITNNFENFVGYEKWIHNTSFNASVSCLARKADPEITTNGIMPFLLQYGPDFTGLGYLNNLVDVGRLTSEVNVHTFDNTSTTTTCAVRVGDGYSTNSLCQNLGCGGSNCDAPSKYLIQPSAANLYCTKEDHAEYTIGCAPGDSYATCIAPETIGNLYNGLVASGGKFTKNLTFRINDVVTPDNILMTCSSATPQTNSSTTPTCTISLPTGMDLAFRTTTTPIDQYQIIYDPVPRDIDPPIASISGSADGFSFNEGTILSAADSKWINKPVTATIRCTNSPVENNDSCTCAWLVKADVTGTQDNTDWGLTSPLKDIVDYQRIIRNETLQNQEFYVFDNVGNMDPDKSKVSITLGVDTLLPSVSLKTVTPTQGSQERVVLQATDNAGGSGLWGHGIQTTLISKTATASDIKNTFDANCNLASPFYAPFPETGAGFGPIDSGAIEYDTNSQKIAYCVQDNAKNELVGTYPFDPNLLIGCFSDGSQSSVPNLDDTSSTYYMPTLLTRIGGGNYGYELTDSVKATSMADFRTKLAQNIETLVKQQYCPTMGNFPNKTVNLEEKNTQNSPLVYAAKAKLIDTSCSETDLNNLGPKNTKGYYYFKGGPNTDNRIITIAGVSRLTGTKVLIVEGADIYLQGDINYFSRNSSLVIISLKDSGGYGGNVYVDPQVTNIDATIIADGALMNGIYTSQNGLTPKVWLNDSAGELQNPLTINGQLLTYNTRGGSLVGNNNALEFASSGSAMCASNTSPTITNAVCNTLPNIPDVVISGYSTDQVRAGLQDLERFRVVMRVPDDLNNRCTLHVTGVMALNRPDILTRIGF